jgi:hypothetical protein
MYIWATYVDSFIFKKLRDILFYFLLSFLGTVLKHVKDIYTIQQIVLYDTIYINRVNPIFVVRHLQMLYNTIFTNICRIV